MKFFSALTALVCVATAIAAPLSPRQTQTNITDVDILQYALSIEHEEVAFYTAFMAAHGDQDFIAAGYEPYVRDRFLQILDNEQHHIDIVSAAITAAGEAPKSACNYQFPLPTLQDWLDVAHQFENVGGAGYAGAAQLITKTPAYLTAAAGILGTEARHASWIGSTIYKQNGWNTAVETPLTPAQIWTVAHGFVASCPDDMSGVPGFTTFFPDLAVDITTTPGTIKLNYTAKAGAIQNGQQLYVAFNQGTGALFAPINPSTNSATVPAGLKGFTFPMVTSSPNSTSDDFVIAGPTAAQFPFSGTGAALPVV
jgi:hypothetical protein